MSILWAGGEDSSWDEKVGSIALDTSSYFRAGWARQALRPAQGAGNANYMRAYIPARSFVHVTFRGSIDPGNYRDPASKAVSLMSGSSHVCWLGVTATPKCALRNGSGDVAVGTITPSGSTQRYDLQVDLVAGTFKLWVDSVLDASGSVPTGGTIDWVMFGCPATTAGNTTYHEVAIGDEDLRSLAGVRTLPITGAGELNTMTGTYADVAENALDQGTALVASAAGQTFYGQLADLSLGTNVVRALVLHAQAAKGTSGPGSLSIGVKVSLPGIAGAGDFSTLQAPVQSANYKRVRKVTPTESVSVAGVRLYSSDSNAGKFKGVIYADSAGAPGALIASTNEVVGITGGVPLDMAFASPPSVVAGTAYWVGYISDAVGLHPYCNTGGGSDAYNADTYSDGASSSFGTPSWVAGVLSVLLIKASQTENIPAAVALTTGFQALRTVYDVNPATGNRFTEAEVNGAQILLQAAT